MIVPGYTDSLSFIPGGFSAIPLRPGTPSQFQLQSLSDPMPTDLTKQRVLSVGQCGFDHSALKSLFGQLEIALDGVAEEEEMRDRLATGEYSLILVNRKLDSDGSDGVAIIRRLRQNEQHADLPVMLVSNYEEAQQSAVAAGARRGFGKSELGDPATIERILEALGR